MSSPSDCKTIDDRSGQTTNPTSAATAPDASGFFSPARGGGAAAATSPAPAAAMPSVIGSYRILSILGHGGMGVVYRAEQSQPRRLVALKVIGAGIVSPRVMRRFEHEAELLGRLQHPGIAQIYEAGTADTGRGPQPYFAMELVEGRALSDHVASNNLGTRQCLELLARVCDAVQYAHQRGVIHRDLKPANILVTGDGQPKVLDFGVARATDGDLTITTQTDVGQLIGTLPYMSPEQAAGAMGELDTRSDVYSLGVIGYEMIARRPPYELRGRMIHEAVRVIREEEPTRLSSLNRTLRGDVETIIGKALEKEKDRRYASAGDFAADIRRYLSDQPIAARPPTLQYQARKFARRNPALVTGLGVTFVALLVGGAVAGVQWRRAVRAERVARQRFDDVRELAQRFMFDIHQKVAPLAGSTPAVKELVGTSLEYLNRLGADSKTDDPGLMLDTAVAYTRVGDIQGNAQGNNLGDHAGALASMRKAQDILERLVALHPDNDDARRELGAAVRKSGEVLQGAGDLAGAAAAYERAVAMLRQMAARRPPDDALERELLLGIMRRGSAKLRLGETGEGLAGCREAAEMAQRLAERNSQNLRCQDDLRAARTQLAEALEQTGDTRGALDVQRGVLDVCRAMLAREPANAQFQRALEKAYNRHGQTLGVLFNHAEALATYQRALELSRRRAAADPANVAAQDDLIECLQRTGDMHGELEQFEQALALHRESLERHQKLYPRLTAPADARGRAIALLKVGETLKRSGKPAEAVEPLRGAADVLAAQRDREPDNVRNLQILAYVQNVLADAYGRSGATDESARAFQGALDAARRWAERDPNDNWAHRQMLISYQRLSQMLAHTDRPERAIEPALAGLAIARQRAPLLPGNAMAVRDVWTQHNGVAHVYFACGNQPCISTERRRHFWSEARRHYAAALRIVQQMRADGTLGSTDAHEPIDLAVWVRLCDDNLAGRTDSMPDPADFADPAAPAPAAPAAPSTVPATAPVAR